MSFFDMFGYGINPWKYTTAEILFNQQVAARAQMQNYPKPCIHVNCPICNKEHKLLEKQLLLEMKNSEKKKELYKKRCSEYMISWRKRFKHKEPEGGSV